MSLRFWIDLIAAESASRPDDAMIAEAAPRHGRSRQVPHRLFHGTSLENYITMRKSDSFEVDSEQKGNHGFSTTQDEKVAIRFARMKSSNGLGVVLSLDGAALAARHLVEPYDDDDEYGSLGDNYEFEWVVTTADGAPIAGAMRLVTNVGVIDFKGDPGHVMAWNEAVHGIDHEAAADAAKQTESEGIAALKRSLAPLKARAALLGLARTLHPEQSTGTLRKLIDKLGDRELYRMLWIYQRRAKTDRT